MMENYDVVSQKMLVFSFIWESWHRVNVSYTQLWKENAFAFRERTERTYLITDVFLWKQDISIFVRKNC